MSPELLRAAVVAAGERKRLISLLLLCDNNGPRRKRATLKARRRDWEEYEAGKSENKFKRHFRVTKARFAWIVAHEKSRNASFQSAAMVYQWKCRIVMDDYFEIKKQARNKK
jgi:hypothetical protein